MKKIEIWTATSFVHNTIIERCCCVFLAVFFFNLHVFRPSECTWSSDMLLHQHWTCSPGSEIPFGVFDTARVEMKNWWNQQYRNATHFGTKSIHYLETRITKHFMLLVLLVCISMPCDKENKIGVKALLVIHTRKNTNSSALTMAPGFLQFYR